jgi:predicted small lipoprotein YifL
MKNIIAVIRIWSLLALALALLAGCGGPGPDLSYPAEADHLLVEADTAGGLVPPAYAENHIPAFRLYGDGRVVWTDQEGPRMSVWQGHLSPEKTQELLAWMADDGYFRMDDFYTVENPPTDLPTRCIRVYLADQSKSVCEYFDGAPETFDQIYGLLQSGAGATDVVTFEPQIGWVTAEPLTWETGSEMVVWPEVLSPALPAMTGGIWVDGPTLEFLWRNRLEQGPLMVFEELGDRYQVTLQIPGLMPRAPSLP